MLPSKSDVIPDDDARSRAESLKRWIIAEAIVLAPLLLAGQIWIIFQLLTAIPGWLAVHNKLIFSVRLLTVYFLATVFGGVFVAVDALTNFSMMVGPKPPSDQVVDGPNIPSITEPPSQTALLFSTTYLSAATIILIMASRSAWGLIKYSYGLPPSMQAANSFALPLNPSAYTSQLFNGRRGSDTGGNTTTGFVPFQGAGRRVQEV